MYPPSVDKWCCSGTEIGEYCSALYTLICLIFALTTQCIRWCTIWAPYSALSEVSNWGLILCWGLTLSPSLSLSFSMISIFWFFLLTGCLAGWLASRWLFFVPNSCISFRKIFSFINCDRRAHKKVSRLNKKIHPIPFCCGVHWKFSQLKWNEIKTEEKKSPPNEKSVKYNVCTTKKKHEFKKRRKKLYKKICIKFKK